MSEELNQPADGGAPDGGAPEPTNPADQFKQAAGVDPQGPWYQGMVSEDLLKDEKVKNFADKYKTIDEALKGAGHLASKIGEKGLRIPGEDADPNEVSQFWSALGRPEEPTGYTWEKPEGLPLEDEQLDEARKALHGAGLTDQQFKQVMDFYTGNAQQQLEAQKQQQEQSLEQTLDTLRNQWGPDFDKKMGAVNHLINQQGWGEMMSRTGMFSDPEVLNMLATVATSVGEDTLAGPGVGIMSAEQEMQRLKSSDAWKNKNHPEHRAVKERVLALYPKG